MPTVQASPPLAESLPERGAQSIPGIGEHASEPHTRRPEPINLLDRDGGLAPKHPSFVRHPRPDHAVRIVRPALGEEQPQRRHHRHLAAGKRQRDHCLAVRVLAERGGVLRRDTDRVGALLGQCGVVDDQHGIRTTHQAIRLHEHLRLQRRAVPSPRCHEMMKPVVFARGEPLGHRLHALAVARADQTSHVKRAHPPPFGVAEPIEERLEPARELCCPVTPRRRHGRLPKPTSYESRKPAHRNPENAAIRIFCQSSARARTHKVLGATRSGVSHLPG